MSKPTYDGRTMPSAKENNFMMDLMILRNAIMKDGEACAQRMGYYKYYKRDLHLLKALVERLQYVFQKTVPDRKNQQYQILCQRGRITVEIPGPIPRGRNVLIDVDALTDLTDAAMRSECAMCLKECGEIKRCKIRQALLQVAPPDTIQDEFKTMGRCEYRDFVGELLQAERRA